MATAELINERQGNRRMNSRRLVGTLLLLSACGGDARDDAPTVDASVKAPVANLPDTPSVGDSGVPNDPTPADPGSPPLSTPAVTPAALPAAPPPAPAPGRGAIAETAVPRQEDATAILKRAAAVYEKVASMQADFVMQFENPLIKQKMTGRGRLSQQRPDRIALRFTQPAGDMIIGDGEYFYVYYRDVDATQATRTPARSVDGNSVDLQAQFLGDPVERFNHRLVGAEPVDGRAARILVLEPKRQGAFRSLKVWIDDNDSLARRFEITEHNGSIRRFDLDNLRVNETIPDATFRFVPPAGVRVVTIG
jgi:outer membrane lipoprotein-sorting protein